MLHYCFFFFYLLSLEVDIRSCLVRMICRLSQVEEILLRSVEVDSYLELPGDELEEGQISKQEGESSDEGHTRF